MDQSVIMFLDTLYAPLKWFYGISQYVSLTIIGLMIATTLTAAGFVLARLGYKPLWALLLLVPTVNVIALWIMAYRHFPLERLRSSR